MKRLLFSTTVAFLFAGGAVQAAFPLDGSDSRFTSSLNTETPHRSGSRTNQQNLIGTVTAIDSSGRRITVKTDTGGLVTFLTGDSTAVRRVPPGQTSLSNAENINFADIKVGDRVLVPGGVLDEQTAVRQVVVMASEAIAALRDQERNEWQARGINGRITALNQQRNEISVQARGLGGGETLTVVLPVSAKILRYAPDSLRSTDARPGTFADLRVGDQIRVLGNRSGATVTAEEIVSGSVVRAFGTITDINTTSNEVTIRNDQTNQNFTVALGKNSVVKRLPPEVAKNLAERRENRQRRRQAQAESTGVQTDNQGRRRRQRPSGDNAESQRRPRGFQQILEAQPAITLAELKKGDALLVVGTQAADASRLTAVNIIVGDAELMRLMQRPPARRNMSPGLPGNVGGGNAPADDEP